MNIRELVAKWLTEHAYEGLWNGDMECGCELGDLMPCDAPCLEYCLPGYRHPGENEGGVGVLMGKEKP